MKNFLKISSILVLAGLVAFSCTKDEIDVEALTDFAPGIVSISPANNSKIVVGNFDLKVIVADGESSPLSEISVQLLDEFGNTLADATQAVTGTRDSIVVPGADFAVPAEQLGAGIYSMNITVSDAKGQTTNRSTSFEISLLPFAANHDEMWIAGGFNGWGGDAMTLVADHTWEVSGIDLLGDEWKIKNCLDWCDEDWGDTDCNGFMESNLSGGNGNTACGYSGEVTVTFNDETLEYTVRPAVEFATNLSGLYLLGTFNNFDGDEFRFQLTGDNTWELAEVELAEGDEFKFAEMPNFMGKNFGDADGDGVAEEFGSNTMFMGDPGIYKITFNDATLEYTMEFLGTGGGGGFESIGIIGSATPGGWDAETPMTDNGDGTYSILIGLLDGEAKFRADNDWAVNWGATDFPSGTGTQDGPNIPVTFGLYEVTFNPETGEYSFEAASVGIIGDSTPDGWDADTDMMPDPAEPSVQTVNIELTDGEAKFRLNNDWGVNWGAGDFPSGIGTQDGPNIPVTAGNYTVRFNVLTGEYSFE
ncbi:MAG: SusF/SusE family outer membrane protein [Phaeodactylibacter xiamenensis]|uniref:SusF/SusE family outer membrane protein n=1 Tax=Phaeodactylibacter xiamenensis TaxID=1524460 RepID=UPI0006964721|nr:hypothetical protein [Phaeodactylibacter xiamenensis]